MSGSGLQENINREVPAPKARPVVKWAGGKRQMIASYAQYFPSRYKVYHEPFLGGGAVFFHLIPPVAILSDLNVELVNMYRVIQCKVDMLIEDLSHYRNDSEFYYQVRDMDTSGLSDVERASRLIYLNKTCYNGLYRVNRKGKFNVPFGRYKHPKILDVDALLAASRVLQRAVILQADFASVIDRAGAGDFVYLDPPYFPQSPTANFTDFTGQAFGAEEHERLAAVFKELDRKGCLVMLSNSDTPYVRDLYADYSGGTISLTANRSINSRGDKRGPVGEIIVCSWMK